MTIPRPAPAATLDLAPHLEGGWYRQTWASSVDVTLPDGRVRPAATLIWFLLPTGTASAWHRVASDELWLAHTGVVVLELGGRNTIPEPDDRMEFGVDHAAGQLSQARVSAGIRQRTLPGSDDALVSCLVSPGFDFADFELLE